MNLLSSKEYSTTILLEQAVNDYSWSPQKFAESVSHKHKTNQQTLMRTIVAVIRLMGNNTYCVDQRNKATHELCRKIINSGILDENPLPIIVWNQDI